MNNIDHKFTVPSRPFIAVECSCGRIIPGCATWEEWDIAEQKHTKWRDNHNPDRTDYKVEVLGTTPSGYLLTEEWCRVHGRTRFSVRTYEGSRRNRRCLACDQDRQKRAKAAKALVNA